MLAVVLAQLTEILRGVDERSGYPAHSRAHGPAGRANFGRRPVALCGRAKETCTAIRLVAGSLLLALVALAGLAAHTAHRMDRGVVTTCTNSFRGPPTLSHVRWGAEGREHDRGCSEKREADGWPAASPSHSGPRPP
jgi:hypothetical protein